jgi:sugar lactone lactonase YvrE
VIATLRSFVDRFLGRGDATITVPSFDGALKPNQLLETAEIVASFNAPEDLATDGQAVYVANGTALLRLEAGSGTQIRSFDRTITALCILPDGRMAVALDGREVQLFAQPCAANAEATFSDASMNAVNVLAPGPDGTLVATDGSTTRPYRQWVYDLMERGRTGRVLALDLASGQVRPLASGLNYAFGVCAFSDALLVSESWRHRLLAIDGQGRQRVVLDHLPAYPSRISPAAAGGFWLTAFLARTQLVEFVLRETGYRRRMMQEIDPQYWVAPKLKSSESFLEPMQGAHIKTMGVVKPWAPPRSYGLVIRLNAEGVPLYALHSRADGSNHGVVAAIEVDGSLFVLAKGPGRLLRLKLSAIEPGLRP